MVQTGTGMRVVGSRRRALGAKLGRHERTGKLRVDTDVEDDEDDEGESVEGGRWSGEKEREWKGREQTNSESGQEDAEGSSDRKYKQHEESTLLFQ